MCVIPLKQLVTYSERGYVRSHDITQSAVPTIGVCVGYYDDKSAVRGKAAQLLQITTEIEKQHKKSKYFMIQGGR